MEPGGGKSTPLSPNPGSKPVSYTHRRPCVLEPQRIHMEPGAGKLSPLSLNPKSTRGVVFGHVWTFLPFARDLPGGGGPPAPAQAAENGATSNLDKKSHGRSRADSKSSANDGGDGMDVDSANDDYDAGDRDTQAPRHRHTGAGGGGGGE